jgi:hypothetical protein
MTLSHIKNLLSACNSSACNSNKALRRFCDTPVRNMMVGQKREVSTVRLLGYFVGGILLANLVLMTSSAFRGHAAQATGGQESVQEAVKQSRGPLSMAAERSPAPQDGMQAETDGVATRENYLAEAPEPARPVIANLCADAREKLVAGLTLYYLQRSRRPTASHDEVLESAGASALLSGPADPAAMTSEISCAG